MDQGFCFVLIDGVETDDANAFREKYPSAEVVGLSRFCVEAVERGIDMHSGERRLPIRTEMMFSGGDVRQEIRGATVCADPFAVETDAGADLTADGNATVVELREDVDKGGSRVWLDLGRKLSLGGGEVGLVQSASGWGSCRGVLIGPEQSGWQD